MDRLSIAVTGTFGYSGGFVAERLLARGDRVLTLTGSSDRPSPLQGRVEVHPFHFDEPEKLRQTLADVDVLVNTYWVRFNHRNFTFADAIDNSRTLFDAAAAAGVKRIVHVSITNPSTESPFEYFRGKAAVEAHLKSTGVPHTIVRPAVLFGGGDILVNNIAWGLRRFPVFGTFGDGRRYGMQPIHVADFADLIVEQTTATGDRCIDAVGPESFTYRELVERIGQIIGKRRPIVALPPRLGYIITSVAGKLVGDVIVTWEEVGGLMADLLRVDSPPAGQTKLTDWATRHRDTLGRQYESELKRRN
jgi:NADH dehydrogenase